MIVNVPLPRYSLESTPIWMCPYCGRVETLLQISTYTPNPLCTCMMQAGFVAQKLLNWPPAATPEDWSLRNAENAGR